MEMLGFFLGVLFAYAHSWMIIFALLACLCVDAKRIHIIAFIFGVGYAELHGLMSEHHTHLVLKHSIQMKLTGIVSTIPKHSGQNKVQFQFEVIEANRKQANSNVLMTCYRDCPHVQVGETWALYTRLVEPVWNTSSRQKSSGYKNWFISNHLHYIGIFSSKYSKLVRPPSWLWSIETIRSNLSRRLENIVGVDDAFGVIEGVTLGLGHHITDEQWSLFRRTGTIHLVVISGEHVTLIAGTCFMLILGLWKSMGRLSLRYPAYKSAAIGSCILGTGYALLAGMGTPIQRALVGFGLALIRYFISQSLTLWQIWRYSLVCIIFIEPHVVLTPGFYLSFVAVALILLVRDRWRVKNHFLSILQIQFICLIGIIPFTLFFFSYGAINGFLANLIAVPIVGWLIVPSALLGLIMSIIYPWSGWFWLSKSSTHVLFFALNFFDKFEWMNIQNVTIQTTGLLACMLTILLFIVFPVRQLYWVYVVLLMTMFF